MYSIHQDSKKATLIFSSPGFTNYIEFVFSESDYDDYIRDVSGYIESIDIIEW